MVTLVVMNARSRMLGKDLHDSRNAKMFEII